VIFTSDNGPVWYAEDVARYGHRSVGPLRGMKADVWEGGNRMPFIARWPGHVQAGAVSEQTVCFTDMMATFAELAGAKLGQAGPDSFSIVGALTGRQAGPARDSLVLQAGNGMFAIRRGRWKLILGTNSGGFSPKTKVGPNAPKGQLYDLAADQGEQKNLYDQQPKIVAELTALLEKARAADRTAPGDR
jgi:arylsulfatase A